MKASAAAQPEMMYYFSILTKLLMSLSSLPDTQTYTHISLDNPLHIVVLFIFLTEDLVLRVMLQVHFVITV